VGVSRLVAAALIVSSTAGAQASLKDSIEARIAREPGAIVAVSYRDLQTGELLHIAADTVFHAASTMKIPVMIEGLKRAQEGAFTLGQELLLVNQFASLADGSPFSLNKNDDGDSVLYSKIGDRVTVRELLTRMITRSSNLATNQLIALVGAANVTATARSLGAARLSVLRGVEDQKAFDNNDIARPCDAARGD
jgi:beta-lactamase class A